MIAATFSSFGRVSAAPGDALYAHPGQMVYAGDGTKLSFYCTGTGSPTVILDSAWQDWSPAWAAVQPAIAKKTRVCSYDRAGSGFSGDGPLPRTSVRIAGELHFALHAAGIQGPYLLVGHSFGGYNIRTFADRYMNEVYGAVFVDIESTDLLAPKRRAQLDNNTVERAAALEACGKAVAQGRPLPPIPSSGHSFSSAPNTPCSHQFFRGLPMKEWSAQLNAVVLHIANTRAGLYRATVSEMLSWPDDESWLIANRRSFGSRPLVILTAQNHRYDTAHTPSEKRAADSAFERRWAQVQRGYLSLSTNAKQILVLDSGHYIQLDRPDLVIQAVEGEIPR